MQTVQAATVQADELSRILSYMPRQQGSERAASAADRALEENRVFLVEEAAAV